MRSKFLPILGVAILSSCILSGCAKGPLRGLAFLNPNAQQILDEEERIAKSWPSIKSELSAMVQQANKGSQRQKQVAAQRLAGYLSAENPTLIRLHATDLLGKLPSEYSADALGTAATDSEVDVRTSACLALGQISDQRSLTKLLEIVGSDDDQDVQIAATRAIGKIRTPQAVNALKQALASNQPALQVSAAEALEELTGKGFGHDIPKWEQYLASQPSLQPTNEKESDIPNFQSID